jgi:hypothetical protein
MSLTDVAEVVDRPRLLRVTTPLVSGEVGGTGFGTHRTPRLRTRDRARVGITRRATPPCIALWRLRQEVSNDRPDLPASTTRCDSSGGQLGDLLSHPGDIHQLGCYAKYRQLLDSWCPN